MKLLRFLSFFGVALAQDNDYLYEATDSPVTQVFFLTDTLLTLKNKIECLTEILPYVFDSGKTHTFICIKD